MLTAWARSWSAARCHRPGISSSEIAAILAGGSSRPGYRGSERGGRPGSPRVWRARGSSSIVFSAKAGSALNATIPASPRRVVRAGPARADPGPLRRDALRRHGQLAVRCARATPARARPSPCGAVRTESSIPRACAPRQGELDPLVTGYSSSSRARRDSWRAICSRPSSLGAARARRALAVFDGVRWPRCLSRRGLASSRGGR